MSFVLNLARREMRASWRRLLFFFVCVGVGVAAIVALRSLTGNLKRALAADARELLTADVQLDSSREPAPDTRAAIERITHSPLVSASTETIEAPTMVRAIDIRSERQTDSKREEKSDASDKSASSEDGSRGAMIVELKGIEANYPLAGEIKVVGAEKYDPQLLNDNGAIVAALVLERLNLKIGDRIRIGALDFTIRGALEHEPGGGSFGFRLGPRVFIARDAFIRAGLAGFGSRARYKILLTTHDPTQAETVTKTLRDALKNRLITITSYKDSQQNLSEQLERAENYLSLAGLVVLALGGVGVANVTRVFIEQKKRTIAALKVLGGTSRRIALAYLLQILLLGFGGSAFGVLLARVAAFLVRWKFAESLPANMSYGLSLSAAAQGVALGLIVSTIFAALPLLRVRNIKPNLLLREDFEQEATNEGRRFFGLPLSRSLNRKDILMRALGFIFLFLALVALAAWQSDSLKIGAIFVAGLFAATVLLGAAASALTFALRRAREKFAFAPFTLRQAIGGLLRPGNQTRVVVIAIGLGVFLILFVQSVARNLIAEFDVSRRAGMPNLYLIDVQPDQVEAVRNFVREETNEQAQFVPTVRARIFAINGREFDLNDTGDKEIRRERGLLGREYVLTYRATLDPNETIIAGKFWDAAPTPPNSEPEVSIDEALRGMLGLDVGGVMTFDVLGRKINARVTSVRRIDWRNARTGFLVLFRPGALESAPHTFIAALNGQANESERAVFQRKLLDRFPNVAVIDVAEILKIVNRILQSVALAVSFVGIFIVASGALILIGSVAMTKFQRIYETALMKTLGAKRATLVAAMFAEYALLGAVAGAVGALSALGLAYAVSRYALDVRWTAAPLDYALTLAATILLVTFVGALSSFDTLARKPLATLRQEQ